MTDPSSTYPHPQYLVKDPAGQTPVSLARRWIQKMTRAVRLNDSQHLISIGMLPFASQSFSLAPQHVSDLLDTLTPHLYPRTGKVDSAVERISRFAATGRPVILGETFALHSGFPTVQDFLLQARPYLDGYLGYYDGRNVDPATADGDQLSMTYARFLENFIGLRSQLCLYRCQVPG